MEVIRGLEGVRKRQSALVTVGSFDGVHLGHQRILRRMRSSGDGSVTIMTFDPHPQSVVRPDAAAPPLLTTFEERIDLFRTLGVDRLVVTRFDRQFARTAPEEFIRRMLVGILGMSCIFIGPHHGFGEGRRGDAELLRKMGRQLGYEVEIVPPVTRDNGFVSSSRIRRQLLEGDARAAWHCLGRPFYVLGRVVPGDGRGRALGFPTANLKVEESAKLMPPPGVYATVTEVDGNRWPSVSHFGERPTFPKAEPSVESHIIGFKGEIEGREVKVGLVDRLRAPAAFDSPKLLVRQMTQDRSEAVKRLSELGFGDNARFRSRRFGRLNR